jgi:hypothetical protein
MFLTHANRDAQAILGAGVSFVAAILVVGLLKLLALQDNTVIVIGLQHSGRPCKKNLRRC